MSSMHDETAVHKATPVQDETTPRPQREQPVVSVVSTSTSTALRVDYDGRYPPLELFFVWTSLGWQAPVPASPPRDAIDWSTPDAARGTSHTIRRFAATGTATLDSSSRAAADEMVRDALDAAVRLGCRVDRPAPTSEIDLRDPQPVEPAPEASPPRLSSPRVRRTRTGRGALACVRAIVPTSSLGAVNQAAASIAADVSTEAEPIIDPEAEARTRVTFEVPASAADSAMRVLASLSIGTPTIEIVTARALADRRG
jgi:hypothetical protein